MAEVTKYGSGYKDPSTFTLPKAVYAEGRVRCISSGPVAIANGDSIGSKIYLGKVPSSAILIPSMCILHHEAVTSLTDLDIGIELAGTVLDADGLADGLDISSAGTKSLVASVVVGDLGKQLWELSTFASTYSTDPGVEFDIVALLNAASGAAKTVNAFIGYAKK